MKGAKEGIIVAQLSHPGGIAVDQLGSIYVADYQKHRVMRWLKGATEGSIVVTGYQPWDLSFDWENNLYVTECGKYRVQKYNIEQNSCS
jgi:DNA-binding beta-propeller fold protein YncE